MAVSITTDLVTLYDGDTAFGGGDVYSGFQRFGSGCIGVQVSNATEHFTGTVTSFSLVGNSIYSWMVGPGSIDVIANGGYRIVIGDGTNSRAYYVGGRDYKAYLAEGWFCFVLNGDNLPTNFDQLTGSAEPNLSALTEVGVGFTTTSKAVGNSPNCFFDIARVGTGLTIGGGTSGDPGTFTNIISQELLTTNAWGIVENLGGGVFGLQGKLTFGSSTTSTYFKDTSKVILYGDRFVGDDFYTISLVGSSTNTNTFILGEKLGTGENAVGSEGVSILSPNIPVTINLNNADFDVINIYGCNFSRLGNKPLTLSSNTTDEFISNTITNSGQVIPNQVFFRNNIISDSANTTSALIWNSTINIKSSDFIGNTSAIEHPNNTGDPFTYDALNFNNNTNDINNTSGTSITIDATNGSNPTSFTGSSVTINNPITFTLTGLVADTEVRIFRESDQVELAGVESSGTSFQYNYNYSSDTEVYVVIHKETYEYILLENIILTNNNATIPVQQRLDRNFIT